MEEERLLLPYMLAAAVFPIYGRQQRAGIYALRR